MKKIVNILFLFVLVVSISSCNKEEYKAPVSNTVNMAGRWYIELYGDDNANGSIDPDEDFLVYSYHDLGEWYISTSNTADNGTDSLILSERYFSNASLSLFPWFVRAKLPIDYSNLKFKPATVNNLLAFNDVDSVFETITLHQGLILKNAATLPSGAKGDSIFLDLEFSQDAGYHYLRAGHRDSGFPEDQH